MLKGIIAGNPALRYLHGGPWSDADIMAGARRNSMAELATMTLSAEKVLGVLNCAQERTGMTPIYLDYNASAPIGPAVAAAMRPFLHEAFDSPSSGHWASTPAKAALEQARGQVAAPLSQHLAPTGRAGWNAGCAASPCCLRRYRCSTILLRTAGGRAPLARALGLHRWAWHRAIRAEHATIARLWLER
jgi:hypothetical protein